MLKKVGFIKKDILCLKKNLSEKSINGIFVPKTEKYETLLKINKILKLKKKKIKLIPIIENKIGYKNLDNILFNDKEKKSHLRNSLRSF